MEYENPSSRISDESFIGVGRQRSTDHGNYSFHASHDHHKSPINHGVLSEHRMSQMGSQDGQETWPIHDRVHNLPSILGSFNIRGRAKIHLRNTPENHKSSGSEDVDYNFLVPPPQITSLELSKPHKRISTNITERSKLSALPSEPSLSAAYPSYTTPEQWTHISHGIYSRNHLQTTTRDGPQTDDNVSKDSMAFQFHDYSNPKLTLKSQPTDHNITQNPTNLYDSIYRQERPTTDMDTVSSAFKQAMDDFKSGREKNNYLNMKPRTNLETKLLLLMNEEQIPEVTTPLLISTIDDTRPLNLTFHNGSQNGISFSNGLINRTITKNTEKKNDPRDFIAASRSNVELSSETTRSTSMNNMSDQVTSTLQNDNSHYSTRIESSQSVLHKIPPYFRSRSETLNSISLKYFNDQQEALQKQLIEHDRQLFLSQRTLERENTKMNITAARTFQNESEIMPQRNNDSPIDSQFDRSQSKNETYSKNNSTIEKKSEKSSDNECIHSAPIYVSTTAIKTSDGYDNDNDLRHLATAQVIGNEKSQENSTAQNYAAATTENLSFVSPLIDQPLLSEMDHGKRRINDSEDDFMLTTHVQMMMPVISGKLGIDDLTISNQRNSSSYPEHVTSTLSPYRKQMTHRYQPYLPTPKHIKPILHIQGAEDKAALDERFTDTMINGNNNGNIHDSVQISSKQPPGGPHEFIRHRKIKIIKTPEPAHFRVKLNQSKNAVQDMKIGINNKMIIRNRSRTDSIRPVSKKNVNCLLISPLESLFNFTVEENNNEDTALKSPTHLDKKDAPGIYTSENNIAAMKTSMTKRPQLMTFKNNVRPRFSIKHHRDLIKYKDRLGRPSLSSNSSHSITTSRVNRPLNFRNAGSPRNTITKNFMNGTESRLSNVKSLITPHMNMSSDHVNSTIREGITNVKQNNVRANNNRPHSETSNSTADTYWNDSPETFKIKRRGYLNNRHRPHLTIVYPKTSGTHEKWIKTENVIENQEILSNFGISNFSEISSPMSQHDPDIKSTTRTSSYNHYSTDTPWRHGLNDKQKRLMNDSIHSVRPSPVLRNQSYWNNININRTALSPYDYENTKMFDAKDSRGVIRIDTPQQYTDFFESIGKITNTTSTFHNRTDVSKSVPEKVSHRKNKEENQIEGLSEQPALPIEEFFRKMLSEG